MEPGKKKRGPWGRAAWCAAALCLLLPACGGEMPGDSASLEMEEPLPSEPDTRDVVRWLADKDHWAFSVGEYWVTVERREAEDSLPAEDCGADTAVFSVWDPADLSAPGQVMTRPSGTFGYYDVTDVNFDGTPDFGWMYVMGNQPNYWYYWIWNEEQGRFAEEPAFRKISAPAFDTETRTVTGWARSSAAGTGVNTIHRWVEGRLTLIRRICADNDLDFNTVTLTVEEPVNGALTEVFRREYPMNEGAWMKERAAWEDPAYFGET